MMDGFIRWPKPYLLLPTTCDELLSWMLEFRTKNHLVSHSNCNVVILLSPYLFLQGMTHNVGVTLLLVTLHYDLQLVIEQDNQNW